MRAIDTHEKYKEAQQKFKEKILKDAECHTVSECDSAWSMFKNAFMIVSNYRCPICETNLDSYSDIDHIQPKVQYPETKCCCKNYLILCPACNRAYKRDQFPVEGDDSSVNEDKQAIINVYDKDRLLVNPREDDILKYFQLHFIKLSSTRNVVYIAPNGGLNSIDKKKAESTIEVYGLAHCESEKMKDRCRVELLSTHFDMFLRFAKAKKKSEKVYQAILKSEDSQNLRNYGFIDFISEGQFKIA